MLRTIRLYGQLAKFLKRRTFKVAVSNPAEAVRALIANFPELEQHMASQYYKVVVGNRDITKDELHHPSGQQDISFIPCITGSGTTGQIFLGVGLIALSFLSFGAAPLLGTLGAKLAFGVGAQLVLGGVAQLLTPVPRPLSGDDSNGDPRKSYSFSSVQQTSRAGVPVPIVFGEMLVGSVVISAAIDTVVT